MNWLALAGWIVIVLLILRAVELAGLALGWGLECATAGFCR